VDVASMQGIAEARENQPSQNGRTIVPTGGKVNWDLHMVTYGIYMRFAKIYMGFTYHLCTSLNERAVLFVQAFILECSQSLEVCESGSSHVSVADQTNFTIGNKDTRLIKLGVPANVATFMV
jgi:hypothetical protein